MHYQRLISILSLLFTPGKRVTFGMWIETQVQSISQMQITEKSIFPNLEEIVFTLLPNIDKYSIILLANIFRDKVPEVYETWFV